MRLIEERRGSRVVSYVYEPNSYVPLARIDTSGESTQHGGIATQDETTASPNSKSIAPTLSPQQYWASTTNQSVVAKQSKSRSLPQKNVASTKELTAANDPALSAHGEPVEPQSWEALLPPANLNAKQVSGSEPKLANIYYFHTDQVGLPEELSDSQGNLRWRASYKTWGSTVEERWDVVSLTGEPVNPLLAQANAYATDAERERTLAQARERDQQIKAEALEQNLRFQGQYLDRDTGLHYNTLRYFDFPPIKRTLL
jgi:hypothetical protein